MLNVFLRVKDYFYTRRTISPKVYNSIKTIDLIIENKMSVSRFGDGEFDLMLKINHPKYQNQNDKLSNRLMEVFNAVNHNLLVCIPNVFAEDCLDEMTGKASRHWRRFLLKNRKLLYGIFDFERFYGDALFTRKYIDIKNKLNTHEYFKNVKRIWNNRDVIIVEGRFTRFGVGNDLLSNANSVKRILCPERNAYDSYEKILSVCKIQNKESLFLIALGPTATVLAYDLCNDHFQAIDIGHLDIEYEWFLSRADKKSAVANKYVNETNDVITEGNDVFYDDEYENSIMYCVY